MILPDRDKFVDEVDKIDDDVTRGLLISLYDHMVGKTTLVNPAYTAEIILRRLYPPGYMSDEVYIPLRFNYTVIGQVVMGVLHSNDSARLYTVKDLQELTKTPERPRGLSKQYIYQEIRREGGFFNGRAIYKGGWRLPENAVKEFLKIKGFI